MTDFLTRLAERSLRIASVVEPLQPPMFAPESPLAAGVPQETTAEEGALASAEPEPSPRFRPVLTVSKGDGEGTMDKARTIAPSPISLVAPSTTLPVEPPSRPLDMQPGVPRRELAWVVEPPVALAPSVSPRTPQPASAHVQEEERKSLPSPVMTPSAQPHETDQQYGHDRSVSHVAPIPETPIDALTPEQRPTQGTQDTTPRVIGPRVAFEIVPTPSVEIAPTPSAASVEFPADQRQATLESAPPAPTIRVSIGRIEVRAIMPPVPPARHTPPARPRPQLSLEDYLRQHRGGSR
jgi:hypothetical protein